MASIQFVIGHLFTTNWNLYQILNILEKRMTLIGFVFPKSWTTKNVGTYMSKESRFRTTFDSQQVKDSKTLLKISQRHFNHIALKL